MILISAMKGYAKFLKCILWVKVQPNQYSSDCLFAFEYMYRIVKTLAIKSLVEKGQKFFLSFPSV